MIAVRILVWIARIAGVLALILGLTFWIIQIDIVLFHILSGLTLALSFLVLSIIMLFNRRMRSLGVVGIVYSLILPLFGLRQASLLVGNLHWLIQVAHLLVGLGALVLVQVIYTRYERLRPGGMATASSANVAR